MKGRDVQFLYCVEGGGCGGGGGEKHQGYNVGCRYKNVEGKKLGEL